MTAKIQQIIRVVADYYGTRPEHMESERRDLRIVIPRHVAMFLAREITGYSYARIGRALNRSDHTSAMYAVRRIERRMAQDPGLAADLDALRWRLQLPLPPESPSLAARLIEALL